MAKESSQKFIGRNRAPRVHITYDLETAGMPKVELPMVMGVMADLSGKPAEPRFEFYTLLPNQEVMPGSRPAPLAAWVLCLALSGCSTLEKEPRERPVDAAASASEESEAELERRVAAAAHRAVDCPGSCAQGQQVGHLLRQHRQVAQPFGVGRRAARACVLAHRLPAPVRCPGRRTAGRSRRCCSPGP